METTQPPLLTDLVKVINVKGFIDTGSHNHRPEDFTFRRDKNSLSFHGSAFTKVFGEDAARIADRLWMNRSPNQADLNEFETRTGMGWDKFMKMAEKTSNRAPLKVVDINII